MGSRRLESSQDSRRPSRFASEAFRPTADTVGDLRAPVDAVAPTEIGSWRVVDDRRYLVLGEYARGGLGRILEAHDCDLDRPVAIKELLGESWDAQARFAREAEITGRLQHPSIVPIYEAGRWPSGKPFYAMKLISGQSLAAAILKRRALNDRLALLPTVIAVADAIAYAHQQGVLHRDLKPSNVLVGKFGETVVIDWGLAVDSRFGVLHGERSGTSLQRVAADGGAARLTAAGSVMGTPEYMPPEQARGERVDETADVYALGAMLYHLVAGEPPYGAASPQAVLSKLTAGPPVPLEQREISIPAELAAIVRKAMARNKRQRYPTAKELAEDLRRFQTGQLVGAHRYSISKLIQRWINRHRAAVAVATLSLLVLAIGGLMALRWIVQARDVAEARRNEMILVHVRSAMERDPTSALAWLKTHPKFRSEEPAVRNLAFEARSRGVARHIFRRDSARPSYVGFSQDGALLGSASEHRTLRLSDLITGRSIRSIPYAGEIYMVDFSPDGRTFLFTEWEEGMVNLGRVDEEGIRVLRGHRGVIHSRKFSPDGRLIATAGIDGAVRLWEVRSGEARVFNGHQGPVHSVDFSPDGRLLASASGDQTARIWDIAAGESRVLGGHPAGLRDVQFSPDGSTLASADAGGTIKLWDSKTWLCRGTYHFGDPGFRLAFSSDGRWVASAGGASLRILDTRTSEVKSLIGHQGTVVTAAFSPRSRLIASGGNDGTVRLWELDSGGHRVIRGHIGQVDKVMFSKDGRYLASTADDRTTRIWSVQDIMDTRYVLSGHDDAVLSLGFSRDGRLLASASRDNTVRVWDLRSGDSRALRGHSAVVVRVAFSPDGRQLASTSFDRSVRLWNVDTGEGRVLYRHEKIAWDLKFSNSGQMIASAGADGAIRLWELTTGTARVLRAHHADVRALAFSPDSRWLASASADRTVRLWNLDTGKDRVISRYRDVAYAVAFSPDGREVASGSFDQTIQIWEVQSGKNRIFLGHVGRIRSLAFSPDGSLLASASEDGTVRLWDVGSGGTRVFAGHGDEVRHLAFSPDGKRLASASWDNTVRLWDVGSGYLLGLDIHSDHVLQVAFAPDGRSIASSGSEKSITVWKVDSLPDLPADTGQFVVWMDSITSAVVNSSNLVVTP